MKAKWIDIGALVLWSAGFLLLLSILHTKGYNNILIFLIFTLLISFVTKYLYIIYSNDDKFNESTKNITIPNYAGWSYFLLPLCSILGSAYYIAFVGPFEDVNWIVIVSAVWVGMAAANVVSWLR